MFFSQNSGLTLYDIGTIVVDPFQKGDIRVTFSLASLEVLQICLIYPTQ